jgi:hypothetical protein
MRTFYRMDGRYFVIFDPVIDLLGCSVVVTANGNRHSRLGRIRTIVTEQFNLDEVVRRRLHHGYCEAEPPLPARVSQDVAGG